MPPTAACRSEISEPPSLWSLDREGDTVILARTFSKTLSPGLKIGYGVLPDGLVDPILTLKANHDFGSANFNQRLLERMLADGSYDRHVARLTELYRRKCGVFLAALERTCGADRFRGAAGPVPKGGFSSG